MMNGDDGMSSFHTFLNGALLKKWFNSYIDIASIKSANYGKSDCERW